MPGRPETLIGSQARSAPSQSACFPSCPLPRGRSSMPMLQLFKRRLYFATGEVPSGSSCALQRCTRTFTPRKIKVCAPVLPPILIAVDLCPLASSLRRRHPCPRGMPRPPLSSARLRRLQRRQGCRQQVPARGARRPQQIDPRAGQGQAGAAGGDVAGDRYEQLTRTHRAAGGWPYQSLSESFMAFWASSRCIPSGICRACSLRPTMAAVSPPLILLKPSCQMARDARNSFSTS